MRNSSELAKPHRLPTACFGLVRKQETESYATQVEDSQPEVEDRGVQATREMKRKLNPFLQEWTSECEASATHEPVPKGAPKGVMPLERMYGSALPKPLSLEQFVALIMPPPGAIQDPNFKTDNHPTRMSSNSESLNSCVTMCNHPPLEVGMYVSGSPEECTALPVKSGRGTLF